MQAVFRLPGMTGNGIRMNLAGSGLALVLLLALGIMACGGSAGPTAAPAASAPSGPVQEPAVAVPEATIASEAPQPVAAPTSEAAPTLAAPTELATQAEAPPTAAAAPQVEAPTIPSETAAAPQPEPTVAAEPDASGGSGYVIGEGSKATFTVNEKLAWLDLPNDAVMLTEGLTGSIHLDGQASVIELDLHSMTSDADRRDGYVRNRMFPDHPTATFTVADLGDLPDPLPEGEVITREVQGELSIRGITKPIVFEVEARKDPDKLFILGRTTFTWDDLEMPPPNIPGRIQVKDEVNVEVLLSAIPGEGTGS